MDVAPCAKESSARGTQDRVFDRSPSGSQHRHADDRHVNENSEDRIGFDRTRERRYLRAKRPPSEAPCRTQVELLSPHERSHRLCESRQASWPDQSAVPSLSFGQAGPPTANPIAAGSISRQDRRPRIHVESPSPSLQEKSPLHRGDRNSDPCRTCG